ncbi:MAG: Ig-like domain-containing protein, partial [Acidobacteriota bacterium]
TTAVATARFFKLIFTGVNPFITRGFTVATSSTCPLLNSSAATASLAADTSCTYAVNFTPDVPGPFTGVLYPIDNNLNVINAQQFIPLNGAGTPVIPTVTTTTDIPNPSLYGQPVVFTAHVAPAPGNTGTPTGDVLFTFCHGATVRRTLDATGNVTFTAPLPNTVSEPVSDCPYTAAYLGDTTFAPSTSTLTDYTVLPAASTTTLTATPNPAYIGQPVTLTATVNGVPNPNGHILPPGSQTPTGTVQFYADGNLIGSATIANGIATLTITTLTGGNHTLTAVYPGDPDLTGSSSTPISETIILPDFTLTATPPTITIPTGHRASMPLTFTSLSGFTGPITVTCGQLPVYATCYPPSIQLASNASTTGTLTLDTNGVPNFYGSLNSPSNNSVISTGGRALAAGAERPAVGITMALITLLALFTPKRRRNLQRLLSLTILTTPPPPHPASTPST